MFNLEQAISEWRRQMLDAGIKAPESLDELESHLRDELEHQMQTGLGAQQAFERAVRSIGAPSALHAEFQKTIPWWELCNGKLMRICCMVLPAWIGLVVFISWFIRVRRGQIEVNLADVVLALGALVTMVLLAPVGGYLGKIIPATASKRLMNAIIIGSPFVGVFLVRWIWANLSVGGMVQLHIAILWTMVPWLPAGALLAEWGRKCQKLSNSLLRTGD